MRAGDGRAAAPLGLPASCWAPKAAWLMLLVAELRPACSLPCSCKPLLLGRPPKMASCDVCSSCHKG